MKEKTMERKHHCNRSSTYLIVIVSLLLFNAGGTAAEILTESPRNHASIITPRLHDAIKSIDDDTIITVMVILDEQADLSQLLRNPAKGLKKDRRLSVNRLLRDVSTATQPQIIQKLSDMGIEPVSRFWIINSIAVKTDKESIFRLLEVPGISRIDLPPPAPEYPSPVTCPDHDGNQGADSSYEWNISKVNADDVWDIGYTGQNVVIGSFDTGADVNHPDLASRFKGGPGSWFDPYSERPDPCDTGAHGTHTIGTFCGGDASGKHIGIAPGATFIAARAWNDKGGSTGLAFLQIFQWFLDPDGDPETDDAPHVVSNSWAIVNEGCFIDYAGCIDAWRAAGIFPSFASGNEGPGYASTRSPANYAHAFGVGATNSGDDIAGFSGRGPSPCNYDNIEPEISAPGVSIKSSVPGGGYSSWNGTSMACPHVTGAVALLLSYDINLPVEEIEDALKAGAHDLGEPGPDNDYGWGRLDVSESHSFLVRRGTITGTVENDSGIPLEAAVSVPGSWRITESGPEGIYTFAVPGDSSITVRAECFGYFPVETVIETPSADTVTVDFVLTQIPTGSISGSVKDTYGDPLSDVRISVAEMESDPILTDPFGNYSISDVPSGKGYSISAEICSHAADSASIFLPEGGSETVDFTLATISEDDCETTNGWRHYTANPRYLDQWHLSDSVNHTPGGTYSWYCGDSLEQRAEDYVDAALETHCFDVEYGSVLKFFHKIITEKNTMIPGKVWDGGIIEVTTDDRKTWKQVEPAGGHEYSITANAASPFEPGTECYGYKIEGRWEYVPLPGVGGETFIRFRFGTDGFVRSKGWWIDDLSIGKYLPGCTLTARDWPAAAFPGEEFQIYLDGRNFETYAYSGDLWIKLRDSRGQIFTKSLISNVTIPPGYNGTIQLDIQIPPDLEPENYFVRIRFGEYPDIPWAEYQCRLKIKIPE